MTARRLTGVLLALVVVVLLAGGALAAWEGRLAVDFRLHYLPAAEDVISGEPIYSLADAATGHAYVYPPQLAFLLTPLTLLPADAAALLALVGVIALLIGTLLVLGVRDPLCHLAVFAWAPTWTALDMASITPLLGLALAVAWRYRDNTWPSAVALGLAIPAKMFLWPLFVWTVATRRLRQTLYALALGAVVTLGLWAVIGFQGLTDYPTMLRMLADVNAERGHSFVALAADVGVSADVAHVAMVAVGGLLIVGCIRRARHGDDQAAFILALASALVLTPILWMHYFVLLIIPLAIARPRFSALWLLPCLLWIARHPIDPPTALPLIVTAVIVAACVNWKPSLRWGMDPAPKTP